MNNEQFIDFFEGSLSLNISIIAVMLAFYAAIFWRACRSLADPLAFGVLAQAMAAAVVLILHVGGEINDFYFYSFLSTETAFLFGCFSFGPPRLWKSQELVGKDSFTIIHHCFIAIFWVSSVAFIAKAGLLLFNAESRLIVMQSMGALSWFVDVCWVAVPILVMIRRTLLGTRKTLDAISLIACILFLLTKGGKSDFVVLVFSAYLVAFVGRNERALLWAKRSVLAVPFLLLGVTAITLAVWGQAENPLKSVLYRLVFFGDALYEGYSEDFMNSLTQTSPLNYFFNSINSFINSLIGLPTEDRVVLGYEMAHYYYGIKEGIGPNARTNILGLYLFGSYGAVLFSLIVGMVFGAIRRGIRPRSYSGVLLYCLMNVFSMYLFIDPSLAAGYFLKVAIVFSLVLLLALVWAALESVLPPTAAD